MLMHKEKRTSMSISVMTKESLRKFRIHPRETDEDILKRLILNQEIKHTREVQDEK